MSLTKTRTLKTPQAPPTRAELLRWTGWFFLANSLITLLIALRYLAVVDFPEGEYTRLFGTLAFVGHFASLGFIGTVLMCIPVLLLPRRGPIFVLGITLAVALVLGITLDTFVFNQYRFHFNGMVFNLLLGGAAEEIFTFSATLWAMLIVFVAALLGVEWWLARRVWRFVRATPGRYYGYGVGFVLFAVFAAENMMFAWADASNYTSITKQIRFLPAYKPLTADRWFYKYGFADPNAAKKIAHLDHSSSLDYPKAPLRCTAPTQPLNILYIVVDSWRFDTLTAQATPNFDRFAQHSLVFDKHYSTANSTRTGIFSLFYGLPGTYWHAMLAEQRGAVFINQLQKQDYQLGIFASAKLYSPEFDRTVFAQVPDLRTRSTGSSPQQRDRNITEEFLGFLDQRDPQKPFFGFLFYDSPHGYDFPPDYPLPFQPSWEAVNYVALNNDFDRSPFFNRYRNSVNYIDSLAGQVLDRLKTDGLLDHTVVLITGDHGQEFNDNGLNYWGHNSNFSHWQTQVPLVLHWPGKTPQHITHQTSHFDLTPTLMRDLLGCENPPQDYSSGKHLLDGQPSPYLLMSNYNQFAVMEPERITVVDEFGNVDVMDQRYRPIPDAQLPNALMLSVMQEMGRFYSH